MNGVRRLARMTLICSAPDRLADFYIAALGFEPVGDEPIVEPAFAALTGIAGATARTVTLQYGEQRIELTGIQPSGQPYPSGVSGPSLLFQHFAIAVGDMAAVYDRLLSHGGSVAISRDGPQTLPISSGGVTAYKFRDPDGHPLELIAFPREKGTAGIDHSAISVADTARSVEFYRRLGLRHSGGSLNRGPEQDRLDGMSGAVVEVTALAPPASSRPHVELLCYRNGAASPSALPQTNDVAATRLVLTVSDHAALNALCAQNAEAVLSGPVQFEGGVRRALLRDPDGHLLCLETQA